MIPKTIHYCWFGGSDLPELERRCIESWRKVMPDWEIVRWDESNFDVRRCPFCSQAYDAKMWAFVSDYARYCIVNEHGGVFLDTDIEVLRPFDDLLGYSGFVGFMKNGVFVTPGLVLGSVSDNFIMAEVIGRYESMEFAMREGRNSMPTSPRILTALLEEGHGLRRDGTRQDLEGGLAVFPAAAFDPLDSHSGKMEVTEETYSIHHYSGTWLSPAKKYRVETRKKLAPKVGPRLSWLLSSAMSVAKYGRKAF